MRSTVRRDTDEGHEVFLRGLAAASAMGTPTRQEAARQDRKGKKRRSTREWKSPIDGEFHTNSGKGIHRPYCWGWSRVAWGSLPPLALQ